MMGAPPGSPRAAPSPEAHVLRLFRDGHDTAVIAKILGITEAVAANALARMRDRERSCATSS